MSNYHLAQLNIARMLGETIDDPVMADFVAQLDEVNALAEASPGFIWRLTDEGSNDATTLSPFDDDQIIINMSVWENLDALKAFVYDGRHLAVLRRKKEWFERMREAFVVLWHVPVGHHPTVEEAKERLEYLREHGPSPEAFTFGKPFPPPGE